MSNIRKGFKVVFFIDDAHVQKDRGISTGKIHTAWTGGYNGHEIVVHGQLRSVPFWRFAEVKS